MAAKAAVRVDLRQHMLSQMRYFLAMSFSVRRMENSRFSRALAFVAVAAFVFLLRPYCDVIDSAHAGSTNEPSHHGSDTQGHGLPVPADLCPSLDHTPVALPDAASPPLVNLTPAFPTADGIGLIISAATGSWRITPRATPPPIERLPFYLRYAHLLI